MNLRTLSILSLTLLLSVGQSWSRDIRFAWFSDTHVGARTGVEDLGIVCRDVNSLGNVDFVIVSGDVTEIDVKDHLAHAKSILDSLEVPYYIIPGNHDTKWSDSGGERFAELWGADRFNVEYAGYRFIGIHQGPLMRMADGYIDPDDIAWVDSVLTKLPDPEQPIFLVQHYPLDPSVDNWYQLRDVIRPHNIQTILHGHGHGNRATEYEGVPGIMSRSTLRRGEQPTGYTLVDIHDGQARFQERIPQSDSITTWHTLDLNRRSFSDSTLLPTPQLSKASDEVSVQWQISTGGIITNAAAIHKDRVVAANTLGQVFAINLKSGQLSWTRDLKSAIHGQPAIHKGQVIVGTTDSTLWSLNIKDGSKKWSRKAEDRLLSSPVVQGGRIFVGGASGFYAFKARNGKLLWSNKDIDGYVETKPIVAGGKVLFGAWDGGFYALDEKRGQLKWKWADGRPGLLYSPAACWPVVDEDQVFIVAPDRQMTAINLQTGETIWQKAGHKVRETVGISEDGDLVFARTMQDTVLAVHTGTDDFDLAWIRDVGFGYDISPNAMVEKPGDLFFSTKDGWIYCLDSKNGNTRWKYRLSDGLLNALMLTDTHEIIVTAADGKITCLNVQAP